MSATITSIELHRDFLSGPALRTRKRVFDLGTHSYSGAPGVSWRTNNWIKRLGKGEYWELYASLEPALSRHSIQEPSHRINYVSILRMLGLILMIKISATMDWASRAKFWISMVLCLTLKLRWRYGQLERQTCELS